ncbi:serine aminopeptidase domain-containing protein [Methylocaldum sp.]|uniref:serine aminopeptidase domain-containing protein n=1 Tax=Methylocaldum sp. TaxID=1969727 RepID=UPI002D64CB12|nr:alpha/beta hydrolase [Methylocaldum sp.]HYE37586.1 alpha/beta hydrolase [Methylocaldum sp.]
MEGHPIANPEYDVNTSTYDWSVRVFRQIKKLLKVHITLHGSLETLDRGHIFLFNHFARFETFIPQYLMYEARRVYCCSVASAEFFEEEDSVLAGFLRDVGVIPNNYPRLLPWLAEQILLGRKIVIFPEGGMVKDRRVLDKRGRYSIYSRASMDRRKHHTGAAVLAMGLEIFKMAVRRAEHQGHRQRLSAWAEALRLESREALLVAAHQPTVVVPANITFYPIRVNEHILSNTAELLSRGLSRRHAEEILIEGNILLRNTDMDIQFGHPIIAAESWHPWERWLAKRLAPRIGSIDDVFAITRRPVGVDERLLAGRLRQRANVVRNRYMREMYQAVTVNLSHLASTLMMYCAKRNRMEIDRVKFFRTLYLAIKYTQLLPHVHLHRSVQDPDKYRNLLEGKHSDLQELIDTAKASGLIEVHPERYRLLSKLLREHEFDKIRIENVIAVYANEVEPISGITEAVKRAMSAEKGLSPVELANLRFDDEVRSWRWDSKHYVKHVPSVASPPVTATVTTRPFFLKARSSNGAGVILVHELLASPAEIRGFGERLADLGFHALGVRLKGHGTSPQDLKDRRWEDWLDALRRGYDILKTYVSRIYIVGAGTGGLLALYLASEKPERLAGIAAISPPFKFSASGPMAPLLRNSNILGRWMSRRTSQPFVERTPEYPQYAYREIPLRTLYELRRLTQELEERLPDVQCPVLLAQADGDPILDPESARMIYDALRSKNKMLRFVHADHHNILVEDIGGIREIVIHFLTRDALAR